MLSQDFLSMRINRVYGNELTVVLVGAHPTSSRQYSVLTDSDTLFVRVHGEVEVHLAGRDVFRTQKESYCVRAEKSSSGWFRPASSSNSGSITAVQNCSLTGVPRT